MSQPVDELINRQMVTVKRYSDELTALATEMRTLADRMQRAGDKRQAGEMGHLAKDIVSTAISVSVTQRAIVLSLGFYDVLQLIQDEERDKGDYFEIMNLTMAQRCLEDSLHHLKNWVSNVP